METPEQPPVPPNAPAPSEPAALEDAPRPGEAGGQGPVTQAPLAEIQKYNFRHPAFLSGKQWRRLRLRHDEFVRSLAARLSIYLRLEFQLQMAKLQTMDYQQFIEGLANPTQLTLFKIEPLRGLCLIEVPLGLSMAIVDRLLGGPARVAGASRELSEIETALLDQALMVMLSEWCGCWITLMELHPLILGHETNGRFAQTATPDATMLVLAMDARLGDREESIHIAFPYYTLEPLIRQISGDIESKSKPTAVPPPATPPWNPALDEVRVRLSAHWSGLKLSLRELSRLKTGDVLTLPGLQTNQVNLLLEDTVKFVGRLGTCERQWAVEITDPAKS